MTQSFMFQEYLERIPGCPSSVSSRNCTAYRFVHESKENKNNFIPPYILKPTRRLPEDDEEKCACYALSLYESKEQAVEDYNRIRAGFKNFPKQVGEWIASIVLQVDHGLATATDHRGHFDLHPYIGIEFERVFNWLERIHDQSE